MPEELTLAKKTENADKAAKAYEIFRSRLVEDPFLTREEKANKIRVFLDAHISVFDAYYKGISEYDFASGKQRLKTRDQLKKSEQLSPQAESMAREIAALYGHSYTGRTVTKFLDVNKVVVAPDQTRPIGVMTDQGDKVPAPDRAEVTEIYQDYIRLQRTDTRYALKRTAPSSYMTMIRQSFIKHQRRTNLDFSDRDREDAILAARSYAPPLHDKKQNQQQDLNGGLTDAQIEGIRNISAFLFRNTLYAAKGETKGDRAHFVENIIARPPKEMLLLYYVIQEDNLHGPVDTRELNQKLQTYVPDLSLFRPKMFNGVMKGFLGRLRGESLLWDKLTNAVIRTKQIISVTGLLPIMPKQTALISTDAIRKMMAAAEDAREEAAEEAKGKGIDEAAEAEDPMNSAKSSKADTVEKASIAPAASAKPALEKQEADEPAELKGAVAEEAKKDAAAAVKKDYAAAKAEKKEIAPAEEEEEGTAAETEEEEPVVPAPQKEASPAGGKDEENTFVHPAESEAPEADAVPEEDEPAELKGAPAETEEEGPEAEAGPSEADTGRKADPSSFSKPVQEGSSTSAAAPETIMLDPRVVIAAYKRRLFGKYPLRLQDLSRLDLTPAPYPAVLADRLLQDVEIRLQSIRSSRAQEKPANDLFAEIEEREEKETREIVEALKAAGARTEREDWKKIDHLEEALVDSFSIFHKGPVDEKELVPVLKTILANRELPRFDRMNDEIFRWTGQSTVSPYPQDVVKVDPWVFDEVVKVFEREIDGFKKPRVKPDPDAAYSIPEKVLGCALLAIQYGTFSSPKSNLPASSPEEPEIWDLIEALEEAGARKDRKDWEKIGHLEDIVERSLSMHDGPVPEGIESILINTWVLRGANQRIFGNSEVPDVDSVVVYYPRVFADYLLQSFISQSESGPAAPAPQKEASPAWEEDEENTFVPSAESEAPEADAVPEADEPAELKAAAAEEAEKGAAAAVKKDYAAARAEKKKIVPAEEEKGGAAEEDSDRERVKKDILTRLRKAGASVKRTGWRKIRDISDMLEHSLLEPEQRPPAGMKTLPIQCQVLEAAGKLMLDRPTAFSGTGGTDRGKRIISFPRDLADYMLYALSLDTDAGSGAVIREMTENTEYGDIISALVREGASLRLHMAAQRETYTDQNDMDMQLAFFLEQPWKQTQKKAETILIHSRSVDKARKLLFPAIRPVKRPHGIAKDTAYSMPADLADRLLYRLAMKMGSGDMLQFMDELRYVPSAKQREREREKQQPQSPEPAAEDGAQFSEEEELDDIIQTLELCGARRDRKNWENIPDFESIADYSVLHMFEPGAARLTTVMLDPWVVRAACAKLFGDVNIPDEDHLVYFPRDILDYLLQKLVLLQESQQPEAVAPEEALSEEARVSPDQETKSLISDLQKAGANAARDTWKANEYAAEDLELWLKRPWMHLKRDTEAISVSLKTIMEVRKRLLPEEHLWPFSNSGPETKYSMPRELADYMLLKLLVQAGLKADYDPADSGLGMDEFEILDGLNDWEIVPGEKPATDKAAEGNAREEDTEESGRDDDAIARGAAAVAQDPHMAELICRAADAGELVLGSASPTKEQMDQFQKAVEELFAYIEVGQMNNWSWAKQDVDAINKWVGSFKTPFGQLASTLKLCAKIADNGGIRNPFVYPEFPLDSSEKIADEPVTTEDQSDSGSQDADSSDTKSKEKKEPKSPGYGWEKAAWVINWGVVPVSSICLIASFVSLVSSWRDTFKTGYTGAEFAGKIATSTRTTLDWVSGVFGNVKGYAGQFGAEWAANPIVGSVTGGFGALLTGWEMIEAAKHGVDAEKDLLRLDDHIEFIQEYEEEGPLTEAQKKELDVKKGLLMTMASILRHNDVVRHETASRQKMTGAGKLIGSALTATPAAPLGILTTLTSFVIGISDKIKASKGTAADKKAVIDRFIDMPARYAQFMADHGVELNHMESIAEYQRRIFIEDRIRKDAEFSLNFKNDDALYGYIMACYANALYDGTFRKNDGRGEVMTAAEARAENLALQKRRYLFRGILESHGFEVFYKDKDHPEPVPDVKTILRKLKQRT